MDRLEGCSQGTVSGSEKTYEQFLSPHIHPRMTAGSDLQSAKSAPQHIGSIRHHQLTVLFESKQVGQIAFGASQVFAGVPLAFAVFAVALLVQIILVTDMPLFQVACELRLRQAEQAVCQLFKFPACSGLGAAGQVASDGLLLVKLTQLERDMGKQWLTGAGQVLWQMCVLLV